MNVFDQKCMREASLNQFFKYQILNSRNCLCNNYIALKIDDFQFLSISIWNDRTNCFFSLSKYWFQFIDIEFECSPHIVESLNSFQLTIHHQHRSFIRLMSSFILSLVFGFYLGNSILTNWMTTIVIQSCQLWMPINVRSFIILIHNHCCRNEANCNIYQ